MLLSGLKREEARKFRDVSITYQGWWMQVCNPFWNRMYYLSELSLWVIFNDKMIWDGLIKLYCSHVSLFYFECFIFKEKTATRLNFSARPVAVLLCVTFIDTRLKTESNFGLWDFALEHKNLRSSHVYVLDCLFRKHSQYLSFEKHVSKSI